MGDDILDQYQIEDDKLMDVVYNIVLLDENTPASDKEFICKLLNEKLNYLNDLQDRIMKQEKEKYENSSNNDESSHAYAGSATIQDLKRELDRLVDAGYGKRIFYLTYGYDTHRNSIKPGLDYDLNQDSVTFKGW